MIPVIKGNIWDYWRQGAWVAVLTNGVVTNGNLVMGRGQALEAKTLMPELPYYLGEWVSRMGNVPRIIDRFHVVSFPTKQHFKDPSTLEFISQSWNDLTIEWSIFHNRILQETGQNIGPLYIPPPGCGLGGLHWHQ